MRDSHAETQDPRGLPQDLHDLADAIEAMPNTYREGIEPLLERGIRTSQRRRNILNEVRQALTQLRLDTTYLMFDLEATRRERDGLLRKKR